MRICHCISDSNVGGAGVLLETLLRHTAFSDSYVLLPKGSLLEQRLATTGAHVLLLPVTGDRSFSPHDIPRYMRVFEKIRPDIVHTHANFTARAAARLTRIAPIVTTRHCAYTERPYYHGAQHMASALLSKRFSDYYIATAEAAERDLIRMGIPRDRICVIPNGSEKKRRLPPKEKEILARKYGYTPDSFVVGMVARLVKDKGVDVLLQVAKMLSCEKDADYRFLIVGSGEEETALRRMAEEYGIADLVTFTGFVPDPAPLYSLFSVIVNASRGTETSCLALSEAMSLGIPAVASHYGGNPFMVKNGENGLLFATDAAADLAVKLRRLYIDRTLYTRLSHGAERRYNTYFTADSMAAAYDNVYRMLNRRRHHEEKNAASYGAAPK